MGFGVTDLSPLFFLRHPRIFLIIIRTFRESRYTVTSVSELSERWFRCACPLWLETGVWALSRRLFRVTVRFVLSQLLSAAIIMAPSLGSFRKGTFSLPWKKDPSASSKPQVNWVVSMTRSIHAPMPTPWQSWELNKVNVHPSCKSFMFCIWLNARFHS